MKVFLRWYYPHHFSDFSDLGRSQNLKEVSQNFTKYLRLMTSHCHPRQSCHRGKASEKIINYRVTSPSIRFCQICILAEERPGISVILCCFLFARQKSVHANLFLNKNFVYKDNTVRSLDHLNQLKVLCAYVDIDALI